MEKVIVPEGYQTVMPYLIVQDASGFMQFVEKVFGATEKYKQVEEKRGIVHAEVKIGESVIMLANATDQWAPCPAGLYVHVKNADETYQVAMQEGCVSIGEPADHPYGRSCGVTDPFGNTWWITSAL